MDDDLTPFLPLAPAALHILLAVSAEDRHGYAIMKEIAHQTGGTYKVGPGTLYDNLQKLLNLGMLDQKQRRSQGEDERRRYYRLTRFGQRVLAEEIRRLEAAVRTAKASL